MAKPRAAEQILELARWAPSGDNSQPWRFRIASDDHIEVHAFDTRADCVYDLDGHSSQVAVGALLETMQIAASGLGMRIAVSRREGATEERPVFDVRLIQDDSVRASDLSDFLTSRSVQRRPLSTRRLTSEEKRLLEASVSSGYEVVWFETWPAKAALVRVLWRNARLRLTMPEAFELHRRIIDWDSRFSTDRVPAAAIGLDPLGLRLMRWAMASWERVTFLNSYLAGTWIPRIQLDLVPGFACGAHALVFAPAPPRKLEDYVDAGRAMQRFWLTATRAHLQLQPEMTPLIFARYLRERRQFTRIRSVFHDAERVARELGDLLGSARLERAVFWARLGAGKPPKSRSLRLPVDQLMVRG